MSAKQTLITLGIMGGLLNSCGMLDFSSQDRIDAFRKLSDEEKIAFNIKTLSDMSSGSWFSFGDEQIIQKALAYMGRVPHGRDILKSIDRPIVISSERLLDTQGVYRHFSNGYGGVEISAKTIKDPTGKEVTLTVMHELLHHVQHLQKRDGRYNYFSIEQAAIVSKLCEAEAAAWDDVAHAAYQYLDNNGTQINGGLKKFMSAKLIRDDGKPYASTDSVVLLKQALIQNGGDRVRAEKQAVGKRISHYMAATPVDSLVLEWRNCYDVSSLLFLNMLVRHNSLTTHGNEKDFNKVLDFYVKNYGLQKSQINKLHLDPGAVKLLNSLKTNFSKFNYLKEGDAAYQKAKQQELALKKGSYEKN